MFLEGFYFPTLSRFYSPYILPCGFGKVCNFNGLFRRFVTLLSWFCFCSFTNILLPSIGFMPQIRGSYGHRKAAWDSHLTCLSCSYCSLKAAQDRTKWRCLINKGASQFEEKRICEAERKRKERKARAKEPSSVSAQSEFTCSICNRQFRAKIGLYSHQRTHKHT